MSISINKQVSVNENYNLSNFTITRNRVDIGKYIYMACVDFDVVDGEGNFIRRITVSYNNEDFNDLVSRIHLDTDPLYDDVIEQESLDISSPLNTADSLRNVLAENVLEDIK